MVHHYSYSDEDSGWLPNWAGSLLADINYHSGLFTIGLGIQAGFLGSPPKHEMAGALAWERSAFFLGCVVTLGVAP